VSEPAIEPVVEPTPEGEPTAPETEPAWSGPSQEEWGAVLGYVNQQAQREQQIGQLYGAGPQAQDGPQRPDPWNRPDTFQEDLDAYINARMQPVSEFTQEARLAEAEERAQDILTDLVAKHGEFDKEVAYARANVILPQMVNRYGPGPKAAEAALEAAAQAQLEWERKRDEAAVGRYTNQIKTLAGAPGEPGSTYQVANQQRTIPDYRTGAKVSDVVFGRGAKND
jgi:hypothetical protein